MAKIALFDSNSGKFSFAIKEAWERQGHEVIYEYGYNPDLANRSDVVFIDVCDNNAIVATTGGPFGPEGAIPDGRKLVVRAIDIELWSGHHMPVNWNKVSDVIFIADHMKKMVERDVDFASAGTNVHHIPCGVDMDKFTLKRSFEPTKKIAFVAELWHAKGVDLMLEIARMLPEGYVIEVVGKNCLEPWYTAWMNYYMDRYNLYDKVRIIDWVEDMNEFLEDKDAVLCCSKKEAFSYATAEGMAKGCRPVIFDFLGAQDIWGPKHVFSTAEEAVGMLTAPPRILPNYRWDLEQYGYTMETMMKRINEVCGLTN